MSTDSNNDPNRAPTWRELLEQAREERDDEKLCQLVHQACDSFDAVLLAKAKLAQSRGATPIPLPARSGKPRRRKKPAT